jgi:imidazolonepropionase-like amidohydrolase
MTSASDSVKGPTTMIVSNGKITAIGQSLPVPVDAQEIDLSSYTVVPGFIDSHIHLWTGPQVPGALPSYGLQTLRAQKAREYVLHLGIVWVRVCSARMA